MGVEREAVFAHHLYELKKGLRSLVLFTTSAEHGQEVTDRLRARSIPHLVQPLPGNGSRVNIYFGQRCCVDVARQLVRGGLTELSREEDFILGVLLGYDPVRQCKRYLRRVGRQRPAAGDVAAQPEAPGS